MLFRSLIRSLNPPRTLGMRVHPVRLGISGRQFVAGKFYLNNNQENSISPKNSGSNHFNSQSNGFETNDSPLGRHDLRNPEKLPSTEKRSVANARENEKESSTAASPAENHSPQPPAQDENLSLPDLTQGIPSTLEYEYLRKDPTTSLNLSKSEKQSEERGGRSRGSLPASAYVSSSEKKLSRIANYFYAAFFLLSLSGTTYLGRNWSSKEEEETHPDAPSGWAFGLLWKRAKARVGDNLNYYFQPAFQKLLPDVEPMFERPYTLVLSLEDLLICSEWSREHGWRLAKRPGVDYFLRYLCQYFELVVFTNEPSHFAEPVIRKLDPYHIIMWPLFREATLYENGEYIKDLSYLNRDLSKVIIIDTDEAHVKRQPENAIILKPWKGDAKDKELVSLIPFLEYIHTMEYADVRKALKSFEGKHIPTEFARREAIARKEFLKQLEQEKKQKPKVSGLGLLGNVLGIKHRSMTIDPQDQSPAEAYSRGKMLQDVARERGQRNYEILEKEIRENGEKWLKEEAILEEKAKELSMKAMKTGLTGWFNRAEKDKSGD